MFNSIFIFKTEIKREQLNNTKLNIFTNKTNLFTLTLIRFREQTDSRDSDDRKSDKQPQ